MIVINIAYSHLLKPLAAGSVEVVAGTRSTERTALENWFTLKAKEILTHSLLS